MTDHKDQVRRVNILIYSDSVADFEFGGVRVTHKAVTQLEKLLTDLKLPSGHDAALLKQKKPDLVE